MSGEPVVVRAVYSAARVEGATPPYDTLHLKLFYPAAPTGSQEERMTGNVAPRRAGAPFPVVVFFNGINLGPEAYQWLAVALAARDVATATFSWVGETLPGVIGLTSGVDLARVRPDTYGTGPTTTALGPILNALDALNEGAPWAPSPLRGALDLKSVILGGHSAGGTMALQNANPRFFLGVKGAFSYAGHTMASTMLGFPPGTILPVGADVPLLIAGGTRDGVIAASAVRYQQEGVARHDPITRTFEEGVSGARGDRWLWMLEGANHFTLAHPADDTAGRAFLDLPATLDEAAARADLARVIGDFVLSATRGGTFVGPAGARNK